MIHLGRASQMCRVEAVEPTFDTLDSAHDFFNCRWKLSHLRPGGLAHALPYHRRKHRERTWTFPL